MKLGEAIGTAIDAGNLFVRRPCWDEKQHIKISIKDGHVHVAHAQLTEADSAAEDYYHIPACNGPGQPPC